MFLQTTFRPFISYSCVCSHIFQAQSLLLGAAIIWNVVTIYHTNLNTRNTWLFKGTVIVISSDSLFIEMHNSKSDLFPAPVTMKEIVRTKLKLEDLVIINH